MVALTLPVKDRTDWNGSGTAPAGSYLTAAQWHQVLTALEALNDGKSESGHVHAASATTTGTFAPARLGSGTASASTVLKGDGTWGAPPAAANGIPAGGTTGQVLQKTSGTDYATGWATPSSSGTVPDASTTTKGITQYGTTAGTAAQGNDSRLSDARTPVVHGHTAAEITAGVMAPARLGTGTPSSSTVLNGAGAWVTSAQVLVLAAGAAVPTGTPAGTVILRRPA